MASQLPVWVQYLQAFSTPAIAVLAIVIGVAQWRTAHQRAVLDLFDRRMEIYEAISHVIGGVVGSGTVPTCVANEFARTRHRVDLLFGPEVQLYLDDINQALSKHHSAEAAEEHGTEEERHRAMDARHAAFLKIAAFFEEFPKLVRPYVKMHQKAPWF